MSINDDIKRLEERYDRIEEEMKGIREDIHRLKYPGSESSPQRGPAAIAEKDSKKEARSAPSREKQRLFPASKWLENPELFIGGNLLGKLGILALVLTTVWFIKFAIDRQWLNESARIFVGLLFGFGSVLLAARMARKRFPIFPPVIMGAAIAILYFTVWGAYYFYGLLGTQETFLYLLLLTLWGTALSYFSRSSVLYFYALLGAFLAPILISTGENSYRFLFSYLSFINLLFFLVSFRLPSRVLPFLVLFFNQLIYQIWFFDSSNDNPFSFAYPFVYQFLLFLFLHIRELFLAPVLYKRATKSGAVLLFLNSVMFLISGVYLWNYRFPGNLQMFLLLQAVALVAMHYYHRTRFRNRTTVLPEESLLHQEIYSQLLWIPLLSAALFYFLGADIWILTLLLVFGGVFYHALPASRSNVPPLAAAILWAGLAATLLLFQFEYSPVERLLLNERFAQHILAAALLFSGSLFIKKIAPQIRTGYFSAIAMALLVFAFLFETHDLIENAHYRNLGYSYVLGLFAAIFFIVGYFRSSVLIRRSGIFLAILLVSKLYLYDIWTMKLVVRIIAGFTLGGGLLILSLFYQKFKDNIFSRGKLP